ncbi:hypothetical protein [Streptomyces sp. NBC_01589]|uniref:hypothetical protein n=1 Tax=unclassified Streptomyces TaxID=2593676 RepID=UPI00386A3EAD
MIVPGRQVTGDERAALAACLHVPTEAAFALTFTGQICVVQALDHRHLQWLDALALSADATCAWVPLAALTRCRRVSPRRGPSVGRAPGSFSQWPGPP